MVQTRIIDALPFQMPPKIYSRCYHGERKEEKKRREHLSEIRLPSWWVLTDRSETTVRGGGWLVLSIAAARQRDESRQPHTRQPHNSARMHFSLSKGAPSVSGRRQRAPEAMYVPQTGGT